LISKESAVAMLPLFLLTTDKSDWRRSLVRLLPYLVLAVLAVSSIVFAHSYFFRFSDGSFSLRAPFWITWPRSFGRVLWVWGLVAGAAILWAKDRAMRCSAAAALAWIGIGLVPYSFLTYSTAISSRQTYLASAGLAMLVGVALADWQGQVRRPWTAAVLVLVLAHNVGYVWFRKRPQFLERAAPTEQLIALARRTSGPIWVRCFPRNGYIAEEAVHLAAGYPPENLIWNQAEAERRHVVEVFCYPADGSERVPRPLPMVAAPKPAEPRPKGAVLTPNRSAATISVTDVLRSHMTRSERIYRILVRAYPREYRARFGEPMVQAFCDRLRTATDLRKLVRFWRGIVVDWAMTVPARHWEQRRARKLARREWRRTWSEEARRALFFARYEAMGFAHAQITPEDLLLGALRQDRAFAMGALGATAVEEIRRELQAPLRPHEKNVQFARRVAFSDPCKRALAHATEEAQAGGSARVAARHLIGGILRGEGSLAARVLEQHGCDLAQIRSQY